MHTQKVEIEELMERFENSLLKKHNYVRIAKQYLKFCESENIQVNISSKIIFVEDKAAVYKTAVNKLFRFLGDDINFFVCSPIDSKIKAIEGINPAYYDGLASSSIETYNGVCVVYAMAGYSLSSPNIKEFAAFMSSKEVKSVKVETQLLYYSALKRLFKVNKISTEFLEIEKPQLIKKPTSKYIPNAEERDKIWSYLLESGSDKEICIIGLMLFLGLRSIEVINLKKVGSGLFETKAKGDKIHKRIDFENEDLNKIKYYSHFKEILYKYFTENDSFGYKETSSIRKMTARISKDSLGIHFSSHSCRFSLSENLSNRGFDEYFIKSVLGHKEVSSTSHYTGRAYENAATLYPNM